MRTVSDYILALGMLITGSINTLTTKLADTERSEGVKGDKHLFKHPFFQADGMFLGEFCCLIAFVIMTRLQSRREASQEEDEESLIERPRRTWSPVIFLLPALCDMTGTSCQYIGLTMTTASVFQMLRGAVVIFTGFFSVIFLKRKLHAYQYVSMILVLVGTLIVGLSSVLFPADSSNASNPLVGGIIIFVSQIVVATQMVIEESFVQGKNIHPLVAVGLEGMWGFLILSCVLVALYFLPSVDGLSASGAGNHLENSHDALLQIKNSWIVLLAVLGNLVSIAFFNFFGVSVTKSLSATHRMVLDCVRTCVIWGVSLLIGWEDFQYLQLIGFVILVYGTTVYNDIFKIPFFPYPELEDDELNDPLIAVPEMREPLIEEPSTKGAETSADGTSDEHVNSLAAK